MALFQRGQAAHLTQLTEAIMAKPKISDELKKMEYEPLLPAEMSLIKWSLILGVGMLFVLYWLSKVLFPTGH
jgi:hypothetical protein